MIMVEDAQRIILDAVKPTETVQVDLLQAVGRVVAEDLTSDVDIAPFDNTAMDGFACRSSDVAASSPETPVSLRIVSHIGAGSTYGKTLLPGESVRIMTGAPIPAGADCVEKIENVTFTGEGEVGDEVLLAHPLSMGENVRKAGEEVRRGGLVINAGETLTPAGVGILASAGHSMVPTYRRPRVGIIATGSELVEVTEMPGPGKIRNSNSYTLASYVIAAGCEPVVYPIAPDDQDGIEGALGHAIGECDFVLSSGGASGGDYDYITQAAATLGTVHFKYVNMRPGKSQTFAVIDDVPYVGLAGNPAAAAIGFEILVRRALLKMQGHTQLAHPMQSALLEKAVVKHDGRRNYMRGHIKRNEAGQLVAAPASKQSSALLGSLHHGNCLIVIPEGDVTYPAGTPIMCLRIDIPEGTVL